MREALDETHEKELSNGFVCEFEIVEKGKKYHNYHNPITGQWKKTEVKA